VNGVLSEVRVVVFDAGAKPSFEGARRRRCTSASERRFGSSLAHTAERLAGLELDSRSLSPRVGPPSRLPKASVLSGGASTRGNTLAAIPPGKVCGSSA
jgi:hypothetical protein